MISDGFFMFSAGDVYHFPLLPTPTRRQAAVRRLSCVKKPLPGAGRGHVVATVATLDPVADWNGLRHIHSTKFRLT